MNISEINKVEKIGHFEFVSENDLGKITEKGNKHFAVVKYKNTYSGNRKISKRSMVIYFICVDPPSPVALSLNTIELSK